MTNATDLATVEILFDNGGGITLQTSDYAHYYESNAAQAARDYKVLVDGGDTSDWEGNDSDAEVTSYAGYRFFDHDEIQAIVQAGSHETSWDNETRFFRALGVTIED